MERKNIRIEVKTHSADSIISIQREVKAAQASSKARKLTRKLKLRERYICWLQKFSDF